MAPSDIELDLARLEAELRRLEAEYNMFFAGRLPRPPSETRTRVEALFKRQDRAHIRNTGHRFRFTTLQSRFAALVDLWDRGLRAREEGRPGPFAGGRSEATSAARSETTGAVRSGKEDGNEAEEDEAEGRVLHVTALRDPMHEAEKIRDLHTSLAAARQTAGMAAVPFDQFAELVAKQVRTLRERGSEEVAFRVAIKDGKVSVTARGVKVAKR